MPTLTPEESERLAALPFEVNPADVLEELTEEMALELDLTVDEDSFEEVRRYLSQNIADSDWVTAPAFEPLMEMPGTQMPSILPQWDGPLRAKQRTPFDDVFSQEVLDAYVARQPTWKDLTGRFDPFDYERLRDLFDGQSYSTFLNRPVLTFKDACDHSILLAQFWAQEDLDTEEARQEELSLVPDEPDIKGDYAERVALARQGWKDAVLERKQTLEKLDAKVSAMRVRWYEEKLNR